MVEVLSPRIKEIISYEKPKIDIGLIKRKSNSKTFRGYLNGCIQKAIKDKNRELEFLFKEILNKFNKFYPNKVVLTEIEIVEGWQSIDSLEIFKGFTNDFIIKQHLKDKKTGQVRTTTHQISKIKVNTLLSWIKRWKVGESHKCYDFAINLGYSGWKELWKERKEYFELYYYPIKILEALNLIDYSGRGKITRLR